MAHSLADRITRAPRAARPRRTLAEIAARFGDLPGPARELLEGTAGCSPFLAGLILREADWLRAALDRPPEASFADDPRRDAGRTAPPRSPTACASPAAAPRC